MSRESSADDELALEVLVLQSWWSKVRNWKLEDIAAGKVLKMFDPTSVSVLRGPDKRLSSLYVRRCFEPLYEEIFVKSAPCANDFVCHLNGNSGVGKSAFLWYFIIRNSIEFKSWGDHLHILYESANYIWEFIDDTIQVAERDSVAPGTFAKASWHLINQKIPETGAIGPVILLAASPAEENVKAAKADRMKTVMYMYPWEKDEYTAMVQLWKTHYENLAAEMEMVKNRLQNLEEWANIKWEFGTRIMHRHANLAAVPKVLKQVEQLLEKDVKQAGMIEAASDLACTLQVLVRALDLQVQAGFKRVEVASEYYKWFGGVVRLLWTDEIENPSSDGFRTIVRRSLWNTDLLQLLQCDGLSVALLHFSKPEKSFSFRDYCLRFCSSQVQFEFAAALTKMKAEKLEFFMKTVSEIPQYWGLRGFVFEELSIAHVLRGVTSMTPMVDGKHCNKCKFREDKSRGENQGKWIACPVCEHWYHLSCARECSSCQGKKTIELMGPKRLLRYYEGSLETALLEAGAEAVHYVWRPLLKNNAAVDFTILPGTLAQPTVAERHPVSAEALKVHIDALCAWNQLYCGTNKPREVALCFFLGESNYEEFGFQSYRDKSRRVTRQAVKGIRQFKVLLKHDIPFPCVEELEIPDGTVVVDDIEHCKFEDQPCKSNYFDPDEEILRYEEAEMNKKRKLAY